MSDTQVNHYTLDMENFSLDFTPIPEGISKIKLLMENFVKMYPSFRQTPDFIRFKDEPNLVARAMMLTPDSPSEIFFVSIREKDEDKERYDMFFRTKYYNEITQYIKKNKAKEVLENS